MRAEVTNFLSRVWGVLEDPKRWMRGAYAAGSNNPSDGCPDRMCIMGAAQAVALRDGDSTIVYARALQALRRHLPAVHENAIPAFNDSAKTSHADVRALFMTTMAQLEGPVAKVSIDTEMAVRVAAPRLLPTPLLAIEDLTTEEPD